MGENFFCIFEQDDEKGITHKEGKMSGRPDREGKGTVKYRYYRYFDRLTK
jgi:hypothetical protein